MTPSEPEASPPPAPTAPAPITAGDRAAAALFTGAAWMSGGASVGATIGAALELYLVFTSNVFAEGAASALGYGIVAVVMGLVGGTIAGGLVGLLLGAVAGVIGTRSRSERT